jgi:hypothetical protein
VWSFPWCDLCVWAASLWSSSSMWWCWRRRCLAGCCHGSWACMRITGLALGPLGSAAAHTPRGGIDQEQNTRLPHPWCVLCCELCRVWVARGCGRVWCCQVRAIGDWILWQPRIGSAAGKDATTAVVLSSVSWFIASISSLIVLLLLPPANYLSPHSAPLCPCTILPSRDASSSPLSLGAREVFAVLPKRAYCAYFIHLALFWDLWVNGLPVS